MRARPTPWAFAVMRATAYTQCIRMESAMRHEGMTDEQEYLAKAFAAGQRVSALRAETHLGHA